MGEWDTHARAYRTVRTPRGREIVVDGGGPRAVTADTEEEACAEARRRLHERYPESDGWYGHQAYAHPAAPEAAP
jgi:hypothetical protein